MAVTSETAAVVGRRDPNHSILHSYYGDLPCYFSIAETGQTDGPRCDPEHWGQRATSSKGAQEQL